MTPPRPTRRGATRERSDPRRPAPAGDRGGFAPPLARLPRWLYPGLIALVVIVVFGDYLSFNRLYLFKDIGSDTLNNFYPQRALAAETLRRGALPGWSFEAGMGQNIYPESLGDPFTWPLLLMGPRALPYGIAPIEVVKILLAGGLFYALLRLRGTGRVAGALVAPCYALCGTMVAGGGWWVLLSNQAVHAAALLFAFELLLRGRARWPFALAVAWIGAFNALNPYLMGVLLAGYALVHSAADDAPPPRALPGVALRALGLGLVGLAAGAVCSLPSAWEMLHSPRIAGHSGLAGGLLQAPPFAPGDARLYVTELLRSFGNDLLGTGSDFRGWHNYLEAPLHYCGLLALLLVPQAFAAASLRQRAAMGFAGGLLLVAYVFPWLRHAFWLFTGDYFRTLSLFVTIGMLLASARALDGIVRGRPLHLPLLAGTLAALLVLLHLPYAEGAVRLGADPRLAGITTVFLLAEAGLLVALSRPGTGALGQIGLLVLVPVELAVIAYIPVNERPAVTAAEWRGRTGYHDHTLEALDLIRRRDHGFYRVEKNYSSSPAAGFGLNDGKVQGYRGTSSYYSFNALNYVRFLGECGVIDAADPVQTNWTPGLRSRFPLQTLASVRYWLVRGDPRQIPMLAATYRSLGTVDDIEVLENAYFVPLGFGHTRYLRESAFRALEPTRKDVALLRAAVIPDSLAGRLAGLAEFDTASIALPYTVPTYAADARACADSAMTLTRLESNHIAGRVTTAMPRVWVFSFPRDAGWSARVDDRPARLETVDCGLTGLVLAGGPHTVRLDYEPPLRRTGLVISVLGLLGLIAIAGVAPKSGQGPGNESRGPGFGPPEVTGRRSA